MADVVGALAEPPVVLASSLVLALACAMRGRPEPAARFAVAVPATSLVDKLLKLVVHEHRPRSDDKKPDQSFPSGHAGAMTAFALSAAFSTRRRWALPVAFGAIVAVGVSRVRHREHWLHDVLAGNVLGMIGAGLGALAARALRRRVSETSCRSTA
ncbi:MAG: phosphatase PAP2 family protein [Kofleriaceae bacterium]|nr:phosphatase PAP2 family protein [Kofleriaceae bacterium]